MTKPSKEKLIESVNRHKLKDIKIGDKVLVDDNIAEVHNIGCRYEPCEKYPHGWISAWLKNIDGKHIGALQGTYEHIYL